MGRPSYHCLMGEDLSNIYTKFSEDIGAVIRHRGSPTVLVDITSLRFASLRNWRQECFKCYRMLSSPRQTALQGALVMAKSGRLELGDDICGHYGSVFNHCDKIGLQSYRIR